MKISEDYAKQLNQLHSKKKLVLGHGVSPPQKLVEVIKKYNPDTILDFGCGTGNMLKVVQETFPDFKVLGYDPGTDNYKNFPEHPIDLIYSTDVLEHIEPEFVDETLDNLFLSADIQYHNIACFPAKKKLPDGRNCHLIVEEPNWWLEKIRNIIEGKMTIEYASSYEVLHKGSLKMFFEIVLIKNNKISNTTS